MGRPRFAEHPLPTPERLESDNYARRMTPFEECLRCGEELPHGDWVIGAEEIRKLVVDPENVPTEWWLIKTASFTPSVPRVRPTRGHGRERVALDP